MTRLVCAIQIAIARMFAETALRDESLWLFPGEAKCHPIIEDEARALEEAIGKFFAVDDDAALKLFHIREAVKLQECARSLTANASRAVRHDALMFVRFKFCKKFRQIPEVPHRQCLCIPEATDGCFVVITHIDQNKIFVGFQRCVQLFGADVRSGIFCAYFLPECDDLTTKADKELRKGMNIGDGFLEDDPAEEWMSIESLFVLLDILFRTRTRSIDAFGADENSSPKIQRLCKCSMRDRFLFGIRNIDVFVVQEDVHG